MTPRLSSDLHMYAQTCAYILHPYIYIPTGTDTHKNISSYSLVYTQFYYLLMIKKNLPATYETDVLVDFYIKN